MNATTTTTAADLIDQLREEGFLEGVPACVPAEAVAIDREAHARHPCPGCRRRAMMFLPFARRQDYAVVLACPYCGAGVEA